MSEITGTVVDADSGDPLEFAAISVLKSADSTLVSGGITKMDGTFKFEIPAGVYIVKFDYISYATTWLNPVVANENGDPFDLGTVQMSVSAAQLTEVEVTAEKSQFQLGLDKQVFNVGKDLVTRGGDAADVLDNIPSVTVDLEGNISLRGSGNVRILIDGRQSGLGNDAIRSLQGDMIDRVEVITNPSARYDAEGMSGIINIILRKNQQKGVNGSFSTYFGYPWNGGGNAQVNVRRKDVNLFASYGLRYNTSPGSGSLYQEYYNGDTTTYLDQTRERERTGLSHNFRAGADWFINPQNTLTGSIFYRISDDKSQTRIIYEDYDYSFDLDRITIRDEDETENEPNLEYNLNYKRLFPGKGHQLTFDMQYEDSKETETSDYIEQTFNPDGSESEIPDLIQRSSNEESQLQWLGQFDYVKPLRGEGKFEAGAKGTYRQIGNDYLVEELQDGGWVNLEGLSNEFLYDETILAAYGIYGDKVGSFSYQIGSRVEYSHVITELLETNEVNDRDYFNFFPSAHIGYEFYGSNTVQLSYSRRIRRPHFRSLNPFFTFSDSRNIWRGNPNLDPEYTSSIEIGHIKYWEGTSLSSSLYYRHSTGVIQRIREIDDEGITVTMPRNLATRDAWGVDLSFSADITRIWKVDGNINFFRQITNGEEYGTADDYSWQGRINSRLKIFKDIETQLRLNYRGPQETTQGITKSYVYADLGASKDIMKGRATLSLSVRDLFNSRKRRYVTEGTGFYSEGDFQWRARTTTLSFNYRLNQKKRGERGGRGEENGFQGGDGEF